MSYYELTNQITTLEADEDSTLYDRVVGARIMALLDTVKNIDSQDPSRLLAFWGYGGYDKDTAAKIILAWEFSPFMSLASVVVEEG